MSFHENGCGCGQTPLNSPTEMNPIGAAPGVATQDQIVTPNPAVAVSVATPVIPAISAPTATTPAPQPAAAK